MDARTAGDVIAGSLLGCFLRLGFAMSWERRTVRVGQANGCVSGVHVVLETAWLGNCQIMHISGRGTGGVNAHPFDHGCGPTKNPG